VSSVLLSAGLLSAAAAEAPSPPAPAAAPPDAGSTDSGRSGTGPDRRAQAIATLTPAAPVLAAAHTDLDGEALCMAKVVHREAGSEPRKGQLAGCQTLLNRIRSGRFAKTICGVANQRGQYFNTSRYNPRRHADLESRGGGDPAGARRTHPEVVPGAMYFRAVYARIAACGPDAGRQGGPPHLLSLSAAWPPVLPSPYPVHVERSSSEVENVVETRARCVGSRRAHPRLRSMLLEPNGREATSRHRPGGRTPDPPRTFIIGNPKGAAA
jgi:hypothetical protein